MTRRELDKAWELFKENRLVQIATGLFLLIVLVAIAAPLLPVADPTQQNLSRVLRPPFWMTGADPSHPFGTDHLGRDLLARMVWGSRVSLTVGVGAVLVAALIGVPLGIVAPYFGGKVDEAIMRAFDVVLSIPNLLIAIAVLLALGQSLLILILVLGFRSTVWYARTLRAKVLSIREEQYVKAARAVGLSDLRIMSRHILPNTLAPIIVLSTIYIGLMIVVEAGLSFLGLTRIHVSWGFMVAESREYLATSWWTTTLPGLCIVVTVLSVNVIGDFLRDVFDPRLQVGLE
ncbi:MAG TPA: ABC transporter permease [Candidatus Limnocylindria bacterium]|nr:ABC transporter permease [Candidatus Limnocylindria bacterium]